jgi:peroxiredoxin
MAPVLSPGSNAPDFTLSVTPDQKLSLKELRGKPVVLFFYPADWSPVCGDQTALYNEVLPEFQKSGAELVGVSVDGAWCHAAFARHQHLHYPLLSDFEPKGDVAKKYGAYRHADGFAERAIFVLDKDGKVLELLFADSSESGRGRHFAGAQRSSTSEDKSWQHD